MRDRPRFPRAPSVANLISMDTFTTEPRARFDECGTLYALQVSTGRIRFLKDSPHYKQLRSIFKGVGIDIDTIETEDQYYELYERHKRLILDVVIAGVMTRQSKSVETRYLQAIVRGDMREAEHLSKLIRKRNKIGLRLVR